MSAHSFSTVCEIAKCLSYYRTDPEIILGCIIVSGTPDTEKVLHTDMRITAGAAISDGERRAHTAFRRVWASPTEQERAAVLAWAQRLAGERQQPFTWGRPAS